MRSWVRLPQSPFLRGHSFASRPCSDAQASTKVWHASLLRPSTVSLAWVLSIPPVHGGYNGPLAFLIAYGLSCSSSPPSSLSAASSLVASHIPTFPPSDSPPKTTFASLLPSSRQTRQSQTPSPPTLSTFVLFSGPMTTSRRGTAH